MKRLLIFTFMMLFAVYTGVVNPAIAENKILAAPTNMLLDIINTEDVIILWDEPTDGNIQEFVVMRATAVDSPPTEYAKVPANESSFIDTDVEVGKVYSYRIVSRAGGFVDSPSEVKSIVVQSETDGLNDEETVSGDSSGPTVKSKQSWLDKLLDPSAEDFWTNLLAVNLVAIGLLVVIYLGLREILERRQRNVATSAPKVKGIKGVKQVEIKIKSDGEHPDVLKKAKEHYYGNRKQKLKEWLQVDDEDAQE